MPFKSKRQQRFMFAAESRGEIPKGTAERWAHHTKSIKSLPEKVHKKESAAYLLGQQMGLHKESSEALAWLGRKIMPLISAVAKPVGGLVGKIHAPAGEAIGRYGAGLSAAAKAPLNVEEFMAAKRDIVPTLGAELGEGYEDKLRKHVEQSLSRQRMYGGAGALAVGVPALAGTLAAFSHGRRRRAEEALQAELKAQESKEANVNKAQRLGFELAKQANIFGDASRSVGRAVSRPVAWGLETVGAKGTGGKLRKVIEHSRETADQPLHGTWHKSPFGEMSNVHTHGIESAKKTMRNVGAAAAGTAAAGTTAAVVGGVHAHKKKHKKEEGEKKEAQLGTPFMDGFLVRCADAGLNEKQTADVIEKAAQAEGWIGKECRSFLERLAACDE